MSIKIKLPLEIQDRIKDSAIAALRDEVKYHEVMMFASIDRRLAIHLHMEGGGNADIDIITLEDEYNNVRESILENREFTRLREFGDALVELANRVDNDIKDTY